MQLEKGERVLAVLPAVNKWIVSFDPADDTAWVDRADLLVVTLRRGIGGIRWINTTYLAAGDDGENAGPCTAGEHDGFYAVIEAADAEAACEKARSERARRHAAAEREKQERSRSTT